MWTDFNNTFTVVFVDKLQKKMVLLLDLTPDLKSVAALPCKIECSTVQLYSLLFTADVMQNRLFTVSVYQRC